MNTEQTPIKDSLTVEQIPFDIERAKKYAPFAITAEIVNDDTLIFVLVGGVPMQCEKGKDPEPYRIHGKNFEESIREIENAAEITVRMATSAECDAAGVEYFEPLTSESAIVDRVAMWLYDESYACLSAQEKLSIIAHFPPIRVIGKQIGNYNEPHIAFDLIKHLYRQREFSLHTFGDGARTKGVTDHITKELTEIKKSPYDLYEWIDVVLLALDGAWRAGYSPEAIADALSAKQLKNENRTWPDWRTADPNKAIEHVENK